jgi:2'-5' RNA ligase
MKGVGFSLWIVPEGEAHRRLSGLIRSLARRFGGPTFAPHVTLLAGVRAGEADVVARAERLWRAATALPLVLTGPQTGDTYFRALYLRVEPDAELLALHRSARDAFAPRDDPPYAPHLSLVYGAPPPPSVVEEVRPSAPAGFEARILDVYSTEGEVERWHRVARLRRG